MKRSIWLVILLVCLPAAAQDEVTITLAELGRIIGDAEARGYARAQAECIELIEGSLPVWKSSGATTTYILPGSGSGPNLQDFGVFSPEGNPFIRQQQQDRARWMNEDALRTLQAIEGTLVRDNPPPTLQNTEVR